MSLNLSSAVLRSLVSLIEKREKLLGEVAAIEKQISSALGESSFDSPEPSRRLGRKVGNTRVAKPAKQGGKRGKTKELILGALKEAGANGISVKELSAKLGLKSPNLHVWFATTGKKLTEKARPGIYRLKESGGVIETPVVGENPEKKKTSGKGKRKTSTQKSKLAGKK